MKELSQIRMAVLDALRGAGIQARQGREAGGAEQQNLCSAGCRELSYYGPFS